MSRSTNAIKLLAKAGIEAKRSSEAVSVLPETLHIATDPEDDLFCPGADDQPSEGLIQSIRNGWIEGTAIVCVNRGTKDAPIPFIVAGRSRKKAAMVVNIERAKEGHDPMRVDIVFCDPEDAYSIMLLENNKQERSPLFNPYRWQQHKRFVQRKLNKVSLSDEEKSAARKEFAALVGVTPSAVATWETMLEAPVEVLAMVDRGEISPTDAKEIVKHVPAAERTEKAAQIAARTTDGLPKGTTKKEHREAVLGKAKPISIKQIRVMATRADALGVDDDMRNAFHEVSNEAAGYGDIDNLIDAARCDGFALLGKLLTGEIKAEDLPEPLRKLAIATLNPELK